MKIMTIVKALDLLTDSLTGPDGGVSRLDQRLGEVERMVEQKADALSKLADGKNLKQQAMKQLLKPVDKRVDKLFQRLDGKPKKG